VRRRGNLHDEIFTLSHQGERIGFRISKSGFGDTCWEHTQKPVATEKDNPV